MKDTLYRDSIEFVINEHCIEIDAKNRITSRHDCLKLYMVSTKNGITVSHMVTTGRLCTYVA